MSAQITRRNFLAGAAASAGLLGLAACDATGEQSVEVPAADAYPIEPEEWGSGTVRHAEEVVGEARTGNDWTRVTNEGGATLGVMDTEKLIQVDGYAFKDLNGNGKLDLWEDWRQDAGARAEALAQEASLEDCEGLLFHYSLMGNTESDSTAACGESFLSLISSAHARVAVNFAANADYVVHARWVNTAQRAAEAEPYGIPCNFSANPEPLSGFSSNNLVLATSFDPDFAGEVSRLQGKQYRAVGLPTLLGPQTDVASEPRWSRVAGTYGEDPRLAADMLRACLDGLQSTYDDEGNDLGWGADSVVGMMKHFPSDGAAECGREAHYEPGKYNVFPNDNYAAGLVPFLDGGLSLEGATTRSAGVMPNYSVAYSEDERYGELVPSAYSSYKMGMLRDSLGYDGLICTDWGVTGGDAVQADYNLKDRSKPEKLAMLLENGVDQFGGEEDYASMVEALEILSSDLGGQDAAEANVRDHARRVLKAAFLPGLFENPYVDADAVRDVMEAEDAVALARETHTRGIVMLKNAGGVVAQRAEKPTVYVPMSFSPAVFSAWAGSTPASISLPVTEESALEMVNLVTDTVEYADPENPVETDIVRATAEQLSGCDFALVFVDSPATGTGYVMGEDGSVTYLPISLQYGEYVADGPNVREVSLAGDTLADGNKENRSYYGQSAVAENLRDLEVIQSVSTAAREAGIPVVVAINADRPMVFTEFEDQVDGILMGFGSDNLAFLQIAAGQVEPTGLLPLQMPASMDVVEGQAEDTPRDMECHVDTEGNEYDFAFGLNWAGVIDDERTQRYKTDVQLVPEKIEL